MLPDEEFWFGEDIQGNQYCACKDLSPKDFWVMTIIKKDKMGHYTIHSCEVLPKEEENV